MVSLDRDLVARRLAERPVLTRGSHACGGGNCARELAYYLVTGIVRDAVPPGTCPVLCAPLPEFNDRFWFSGSASSDAARDAALRGYAVRVLGTRSSLEVERRRAYALVDEVRLIVADLLDVHGTASRLRGCAPIVNARSARAVEVVLEASEAVLVAAKVVVRAVRSAAEAELPVLVATRAAAAVAAVAVTSTAPGLDLATLSRRFLDRGFAVVA